MSSSPSEFFYSSSKSKRRSKWILMEKEKTMRILFKKEKVLRISRVFENIFL